MGNNSKLIKAIAITGAIFVITLGLDQLTKIQTENNLKIWSHPTNPHQYGGHSYEFIQIGDPTEGERPFFIGLNFRYVQNPGMGFSALATLPESIRNPFFIGMFLVVIVIFGVFMKSIPFEYTFMRYGLIMVLSGAVGNLIDRVRIGYVIDMISFKWDVFGYKHAFAVFNVADVFVLVGIVTAMLAQLYYGLKKKKQRDIVRQQQAEQRRLELAERRAEKARKRAEKAAAAKAGEKLKSSDDASQGDPDQDLPKAG